MPREKALTDAERDRVDAILRENAGLARAVAYEQLAKLPPHARSRYDVEELESVAMIGMMACAGRYDGKKHGTTFSQYASRRMVGSIIDFFRKNNRWMTGDRDDIRDGAIDFKVQDDTKFDTTPKKERGERNILLTLPKVVGASQRAAYAVTLLARLEPTAQKRKGRRKKTEKVEKIPPIGKSRDQAARATGANPRYVSIAKRIRAYNSEIFEMLLNGEITISGALRRLPMMK